MYAQKGLWLAYLRSSSRNIFLKAASDGANTDARAASGNSSWIRLSIAFFTWYQQTKRIMSWPNTSEEPLEWQEHNR